MQYVQRFLVSIVVSIPACHAGDRGSIPRLGGLFLPLRFFFSAYMYVHRQTTIIHVFFYSGRYIIHHQGSKTSNIPMLNGEGLK